MRPSNEALLCSNRRDSMIEPPTKMRKVLLQTMGQQLREVGAMRNHAADTSTPSNSSETCFTKSVHGGAVDQIQRHETETPESDVVPGEEHHLLVGQTKSVLKTLWRQLEVASEMALEDPGSISFDDLLDWSRSYFDNWHPAYPFLHAPSVLEDFREIAKNGVSEFGSNVSFRLTIIRAIMSISLADRRQTLRFMRPVPEGLVFRSYNDAIDNIQRAFTDEPTTLSLQALVSVLLFLLSMLRYNAASRLESLAVRMTFHLGLHRCPSRYPALAKKDIELRKRLFWSIYCIDRYICIRLGLPLGIQDQDIDVCSPSSETHDREGKDPADCDKRLQLLEFLKRHAKIRGSILQLRSTSVLQDEAKHEQITIISVDLAKWWNDVDEYLEYEDSDESSIGAPHRLILAILRYEAVLALNRSALANLKKSLDYNSALQDCIGASRFVINTLHKALERWKVSERTPIPQDAQETPPLLWPSFTWAVWISSFIMLHAANEEQTSREGAIKLVNRSLEILEHLALRGSVWPEASAAAIRDLRGRFMIRDNPFQESSSENGKTQSRSIGEEPLSAQFIRYPGNRETHESDPSADHDYSEDQYDQDQHSARTATKPRSMERPSNLASSIADFGGVLDQNSSGKGKGSVVGSSHLLNHETEYTNIYHFNNSQWGLPGPSQHQHDMPMQSEDGMDFFDGLNIPFWLGDDQWQSFEGHDSA